MLKSYDLVTKKAVADHIVAAADVFTTADKEVPTQAAQIQNLILQGYDAIVINASSPDALNGAIKQALRCGHRGGLVRRYRHRALRLARRRRLQGHGDAGSRTYAKLQPKGGNLLEIRGLAGTSIDEAIHSGIVEGVAKHSGFKIVSSVTGDWDQTRRRRQSRPYCLRSRLWSASSIRVATATARPRLLRPPTGRVRRSLWATDKTSCNGGRNRKPRTATSPGRPRSLRASRRSHSGWRSRSSMAARMCLTICWSPISPSLRTISRRSCRRLRRAASPATNTRRTTRSRPSKRT